MDPLRAHDLCFLPTPAPLDGWSRHGLGLALYALGRFEEAERVWTDLLVRTVPAPIARDVAFWHGETFGRIGRYHDAEVELKRFTDGGSHALLETGLLRQGWWALAGDHPKEAVAAMRAVLAMPVRSTAGSMRSLARNPSTNSSSLRSIDCKRGPRRSGQSEAARLLLRFAMRRT